MEIPEIYVFSALCITGAYIPIAKNCCKIPARMTTILFKSNLDELDTLT